MRKSIVRILLTLCILSTFQVSASSSLQAQNYDFGDLEKDSSQGQRQSTNLTNRRQLLRRGSLPGIKQFEVDFLGDELLWVIVENKTLHLSRGNPRKLTPGERKRDIPGEVLRLDLYPLPHQPSQALLTVNFRSTNTVNSIVYAVNISNNELMLRNVDRKNGTVLRPVGRYIHGQAFNPSSFWNGEIYRYRTTSFGYERAEIVNFPLSQPRLFSLTWLKNKRWSFVTPTGNLNLIEGKTVLNTVMGDFGGTPHELSSQRSMSRRPETAEPIRMPPSYLEPKDLLAVARNPSNPDGLESLLFGNTQGSPDAIIHFFEIRRDQLTRTGSIGPLEGRIIDMGVPRANREQLLWIRVGKSGNFFLEMFDSDNTQ